MSVPNLDAWHAHLVAARAQTLEDLASTGSATVGLLISETAKPQLLRTLEADAVERGFALANVSLAKGSLHRLDLVFARIAAALRASDIKPGRRHGLMCALEAFADEHGRNAVKRFEEFADAEGLDGELHALSVDVLEVLQGGGASTRLKTWLSGRDLAANAEELALRPLAPRTAKRGLVQLTRLIRALGYRGLRIVLSNAESLVDLPRARREVAYTVLRELVDNADSRRGLVSTELLVSGTSRLLERRASIGSHPALASRLLETRPEERERAWPRPHQRTTWLEPPLGFAIHGEVDTPPALVETPQTRSPILRAQLRLAQGLPPLDATDRLAVAMERVDSRVDGLFEHAALDSSVFAILSGDYGAGKTHHLLHLESRALRDSRPVFRLSIERLDEDLGNPQRHLHRLLAGGVLPKKNHPTPLERLETWLATPAWRRRLLTALEEINETDTYASAAAEKALRETHGTLNVPQVRTTLTATDLETRPGAKSYRRDAYTRLHLWLELLERLDGCRGPVLILDEAENLFRAGVSWAERRTALRSLSFYCGGAVPRACVILALTPDSLEGLRAESNDLLDEIGEQVTLLPEEDIEMFRRRLRARPIHVSKMKREELTVLARKAYALGCQARDLPSDRGIGATLDPIVRTSRTPREVVQRVAAHVEKCFWAPA